MKNIQELIKKYGVYFSEYGEFDLSGIEKLIELGAKKASQKERETVDCNPDNEVLVLPEGVFVGADFGNYTQEELAEAEHQQALDRKLI